MILITISILIFVSVLIYLIKRNIVELMNRKYNKESIIITENEINYPNSLDPKYLVKIIEVYRNNKKKI